MNNKIEDVLCLIEKASEMPESLQIGKHSTQLPNRITFLPIIGRVKGKLLEDTVKKHKPELILEVGTLVGYSAILMARNMEKGKIISLEIDKKAAEIAKENIRKAGLKNKVDIILGDARDTIKKLDKTFDMIFIDAAKKEYFEYLKLLEDKMHKGTIIVADNAKIFSDAMSDYLDYVRNSGKYDSKFYDFGFDGVEVSVRL